MDIAPAPAETQSTRAPRTGVLLAGVDEAGYGPLLGPLCIGLACSAWLEAPGEIDAANHHTPDLWRTLRTILCRKPSDTRRRIAVDDSKRLRACAGGHEALERGVLAFISACGTPDHPEDDASLLTMLGAEPPGEPWYAPPSAATPRPRARWGIDGPRLRTAMSAAGLAPVPPRVHVVGERGVNERCIGDGGKGAILADGLVWAIRQCAHHCDSRSLAGAIIDVDRHGGRLFYAQTLADRLPGWQVLPVVESAERSVYRLEPGDDAHAPILLRVSAGADTSSMPVALASMSAKLVREVLMSWFNAYWSARLPELRPTAGYRQDGWRWLEDASKIIPPEERSRLVRIK